MSDEQWQQVFRDRMRGFHRRHLTDPGEAVALSVKVHVVSGCFHREHSPQAYALIDRLSVPLDVEIIEHESGPELLVYAALATAGLTLAKSVIDLIAAIIKARSEGVKKGDRPADPLELMVRRVDDGSEFREEVVLRIGHTEKVDLAALEKLVDQALHKLCEKSGSALNAPPAQKKRTASKKSHKG